MKATKNLRPFYEGYYSLMILAIRVHDSVCGRKNVSAPRTVLSRLGLALEKVPTFSDGRGGMVKGGEIRCGMLWVLLPKDTFDGQFARFSQTWTCAFLLSHTTLQHLGNDSWNPQLDCSFKPSCSSFLPTQIIVFGCGSKWLWTRPKNVQRTWNDECHEGASRCFPTCGNSW